MRGRFLLLLATPAATLAQEIVPRGDNPTDVVPRHLSEVSYLGASECYDADATFTCGEKVSYDYNADGGTAPAGCCYTFPFTCMPTTAEFTASFEAFWIAGCEAIIGQHPACQIVWNECAADPTKTVTNNAKPCCKEDPIGSSWTAWGGPGQHHHGSINDCLAHYAHDCARTASFRRAPQKP
jgi:hypothetical protein